MRDLKIVLSLLFYVCELILYEVGAAMIRDYYKKFSVTNASGHKKQIENCFAHGHLGGDKKSALLYYK